MSRTLSTYNQDNTEAPLTQPFYLVNIVDTLFYSSAREMVYDGDTYAGDSSFKLGQISTDSVGNSKCSLTLNEDSLLTTAVGTDVSGGSIKIYKGYISVTGTLDQDPVLADLILLIDGVIDTMAIGNNHRITVNLFSTGQRILFSPRLYIKYPSFNFLPSGGSAFHIGQNRENLPIK